MTVIAKPLVGSKFIETAITTQYTTPPSTRTIIDKFSGTNGTAAAATVTVYLVASGNTAVANNIVSYIKTIAAGEVYTFPELVGHVLNAGDFISTSCGTASAIVMRCSGREVT